MKHFGRDIRILHWCTDQMMTDALSRLGLTSSQAQIMGFLLMEKTPPCPSDVEQIMQLSHPTVSGLLNRLEKKGFVETRTDPYDRRVKRIYVLDKGREMASMIELAIQEIETHMLRNFSPEERELFARFLDRAITNMGGATYQNRHRGGWAND